MTTLTAMPKYEAYKDSGIEWIGKIPKTWFLRKAKYLLSEVNIRSENGDETLLSLSKYHGVIPKDSLEERSGGAESLIGYKKVSVNQLVINKMQAVNGLLAVSNLDGITSPDYSVYEAKGIYSSNIKYLEYLLIQPEYLAEFKRRVTGVMEGFIRLYTDDLFAIQIVQPSLEEQARIVSFLDEKTAKIDEAIAIKEKQIELLKERKQIIIQQAVTQGLDLTVPMKDSGVEWIGMIPAHWTCINFRQIIDILTDYTANGSFADLAKNVTYLDEPSYSRLVRLTDLRKNLENDGVFLNKKSHIYLRKSELFGGELLMANVGAYAGLAWLMPKINMPATLAPNMFMIKVNYEKGLTEYISALINSECYWCYIKTIAQASAQPKLNKENIRSLKILLPPIDEQHKIFEYLKLINEEYEGAINLHLEQIEKLKEYKTTLINSAVTGKIKVV